LAAGTNGHQSASDQLTTPEPPPAPPSRRVQIARAYVEKGASGARRELGVSRQRVHQAMTGLFAVDGLTAACKERHVDAPAIATVIAEAMGANKTLLAPDGQGGVIVHEVADHPTRLRAVGLLIDVEMKLKLLDQTVVEEEVGVAFDGVDLLALGRDELTALVMRRTIRGPR